MKGNKMNVGSFCFEAMLHQKFHIYAGGLGVVQAGLLKSGARNDWPINLYGLGILWKRGYYDQRLDPSMGMVADYVPRQYGFLEDTGVKVEVEINGRSNLIRVWLLTPKVFGTAPFFLLDTDLEENDEPARSITQCLYGGNERTRLAQEIVLGVGGVRAFEKLDIPIDLYHGQEGHSVMIALELLRKYLEDGFSQEEAVKATKQKFVATTHTPELAGNEEHDIGLMAEMGCFPQIPTTLAESIGGNPFNMTVALLRLAKRVNAVSKLHLETTNKMWCRVEARCPIVSVTNGVDADWQKPDFAKALTPFQLQETKAGHKRTLVEYIRKRTSVFLKEDILTMVWARRFSDYKRPWLALLDWPWLEKLLWSDKLQLVIAGKPHPNDMRSIYCLNDIYQKSLRVPNLVMLAGYERNQSEMLKAGSDLWLFTSRRPREACSTSGMSAALNGTLNLACRDGWYEELPDEYFFPFGVYKPCRTEGEQDTTDYRDFTRAFQEAAGMYYSDKEAWYEKALLAKKYVEENFTSDRMLADYIDLMYLP
ncbi:MAG: alpha-glucan family phosphorylase [Candidatus Nealsonbacteria bacterium]|nr:alpha-glucan family phosphorylase [Candidatus Nealsonbacteria bacterium]